MSLGFDVHALVVKKSFIMEERSAFFYGRRLAALYSPHGFPPLSTNCRHSGT